MNKYDEVKMKVFVGLSGGVDSSVAAALLKEQGYDVTGVFIKVWDAPWLPCDWREERRSAMRAAARLRIPFRTLDLEEEYKSGVVDYMISEYASGRIPNPDVMCNKSVKFGGFYQWALSQGADYIATGHYARTSGPGVSVRLMAAIDPEKEQTYFLWNMPQEALLRTIFPIGHLQKTAVREEAKRFGLHTATKKDSQGLCFLGPVDIATFISHYVECVPGEVVNTNGDIIGEHDGALLYTVGQRHGFRIFKKSPDALAQFVLSKNMATNRIVVGTRAGGSGGAGATIVLSHLNMLAPKEDWCNLDFVFRYHGARTKIESTEWSEDGVIITLSNPVSDVAVGQSGVCYSGEICVGGGVIESVI